MWVQLFANYFTVRCSAVCNLSKCTKHDKYHTFVRVKKLHVNNTACVIWSILNNKYLIYFYNSILVSGVIWVCVIFISQKSQVARGQPAVNVALLTLPGYNFTDGHKYSTIIFHSQNKTNLTCEKKSLSPAFSSPMIFTDDSPKSPLWCFSLFFQIGRTDQNGGHGSQFGIYLSMGSVTSCGLHSCYMWSLFHLSVVCTCCSPWNLERIIRTFWYFVICSSFLPSSLEVNLRISFCHIGW